MGVLWAGGYNQKQIKEMKAYIAKCRERDICTYTDFPDNSGLLLLLKFFSLFFFLSGFKNTIVKVRKL